MPSRKNYKDEQSYQLELKRVRDNRLEEASKKINVISIKAKGEAVELSEKEMAYTGTRLVDARSKAADKVAEALRHHLLRRWHSTYEGRCIIVVEHVFQRNVVYYTVELTSYGAILQKDWLKDELREMGLKISGYQTARDLVVNQRVTK